MIPVVLCILICGCAAKPVGRQKSKEEAVKSNTKERPPIAVAVEDANTLQKSFDPKKPEEPAKPIWFIAWKKANLNMVNGMQSGKMWDVKGKVYRDGKESSTFIASEAEAKAKQGASKDDPGNQLNLSNGVKITSPDGKSTLVAKNVEWIASKKVFKASGAVTVEGPKGVIGPTGELYATSELDKLATSESYFQK